MKSSNLRNFTAVMAKFMFILSWIGGAGILVPTILCIIVRDEFIKGLTEDADLDMSAFAAFGFDITQVNESQVFPVLIIVFLSITAILVLMGFIFRNVNLIFRKTNTDSPFSQTNVTLIKQIGFAAISLPIVKLIANIILGLLTGTFALGVELSEVLFGLVILCLAQYFVYGSQLERDVEGLL